MVASSLLLKVCVPVILAGAGVTAVVTAPGAQGRPGEKIWIDSPVAGDRLRPGTVDVLAHATSPTVVGSLRLVVDGKTVARVSQLARYGRLASAHFTWTATAGFHALQVTEPNGLGSEVVVVRIGESGVVPRPTSAPTSSGSAPSPSASASASASAVATPTPSPDPSPSDREPSASPTRRPSTSPTPRPSPTAVPRPLVGAVQVSPAQVYGADCAGDITVTATVTGAVSASARVTGLDVDASIGGSVRRGVFTATFGQHDLRGVNTSGTFRIDVTATNPSGSTTRSATVTVACSKD